MLSWKNAVRAISYTQEEMDNNKHRCICPENDNPGEYGENSNLPCMSYEPDCDLCCKDCIYCEMIGPKSSINFGIIDLCFNIKHKDKVIEILESNKESVLNYEIDESQEDEVYIFIDNYDNKTIGNILNKLAEI